jgi:alpha-maltose-1-phosphate synthase
MTILFGHPTGNANSHHCALAHFEAGVLESFCVPWMPSPVTLRLLGFISPIRSKVDRLSRRYFPALSRAPKTQGRVGEMRRLLWRGLGFGDERLSVQANEWLMRTMARNCANPRVTAVHAYEDCSLWQFRTAKRAGKACIYNMPIGYHVCWRMRETELTRKYAGWLPAERASISAKVSAAHKSEEMALADLVIAPSSFAESTIRRHFPDKRIIKAAYGVDSAFWIPPLTKRNLDPLTFIYAGQLTILKGIPLLIEAWKRAELHNAKLELVGSWRLAEQKRLNLPANIMWRPPCSSRELRSRYQKANVFVFPSNFEGFGLVLTEALACGLPVICSEATAGPELVDEYDGRVFPADNLDALVESLRWFDRNRSRIAAMSKAARSKAVTLTWASYRRTVTSAVEAYV